jgi:hypothetical protein
VRVADGREVCVTLGSNPVVAIEQRRGEPSPDVLAYWCPRAPEGRELPSEAVLLGAVGARERRFALPPAAASAPGAIALFSLAHFETLGAVSLGP